MAAARQPMAPAAVEPKAVAAATGRQEGAVLTVEFEIQGQEFLALNGGPQFKFTEAVSFMVMCENQDEVDRYWAALSAVPEAEQCGWCTDKFGITWQVVPTVLYELLADPAKTEKVTAAFLQMKKFDIEKLVEAGNA